MNENRKEPRNQFTALGQLNIAGELLDFISYDISVNGILVEVLPGVLLSNLEDFEKLLKEGCTAEFFVKDLMFTGEAELVRVSQQDESVFLGFEFRNIIYNANRLWHRRRYYRKSKRISGIMVMNETQQIAFETVDVSVKGAMIELIGESATEQTSQPKLFELSLFEEIITPGMIVKILMKDLNFKAIAEIIWIGKEVPTYLGINYLHIEHSDLILD
jgi:hypothetical protein